MQDDCTVDMITMTAIVQRKVIHSIVLQQYNQIFTGTKCLFQANLKIKLAMVRSHILLSGSFNTDIKAFSSGCLKVRHTHGVNILLGCCQDIQSDTKKRELLKNPTKIEEIQEKKFIDRN